MSALNIGSEDFIADEIAAQVLNVLPDGVCFLDLSGNIRVWNQEADAITGYSYAEAACARRPADVLSLSDMNGDPLLSLAGIGSAPTPLYLRHKDAFHLLVTVRRVEVPHYTGEPLGTLFLLQRFTLGASAVASSEVPQGLIWVQIDNFTSVSKRVGPEATEKILAIVQQTAVGCPGVGQVRVQPESGGALIQTCHGSSTELAFQLSRLLRSSRIQWWGESIDITVSIATATLAAEDNLAAKVCQLEESARELALTGGNTVRVLSV